MWPPLLLTVHLPYDRLTLHPSPDWLCKCIARSPEYYLHRISSHLSVSRSCCIRPSLLGYLYSKWEDVSLKIKSRKQPDYFVIGCFGSTISHFGFCALIRETSMVYVCSPPKVRQNIICIHLVCFILLRWSDKLKSLVLHPPLCIIVHILIGGAECEVKISTRSPGRYRQVHPNYTSYPSFFF